MWVGTSQTRLLETIKEYGLHTRPQFLEGKNILEVDGKRLLGDKEPRDGLRRSRPSATASRPSSIVSRDKSRNAGLPDLRLHYPAGVAEPDAFSVATSLPVPQGECLSRSQSGNASLAGPGC